VSDEGEIFVTLMGNGFLFADGSVAIIRDGAAFPFTTGLYDPKGIVAAGDYLYTTDKTKVIRIDKSGAFEVYVDSADFPTKPRFLNDIVAAPNGNLYVSDSGAFIAGGAIYEIRPDRSIRIVIDSWRARQLKGPDGLEMDGPDHLLLTDIVAGTLSRVSIEDGSIVELAKNLGGVDGITRDAKGRLYLSDWHGGKIYRMDTTQGTPYVWQEGFRRAAGICFDPKNNRILVTDVRADKLFAVPIED
jgi:sugar lactone lactonase YvrE